MISSPQIQVNISFSMIFIHKPQSWLDKPVISPELHSRPDLHEPNDRITGMQSKHSSSRVSERKCVCTRADSNQNKIYTLQFYWPLKHVTVKTS